MIEIKLNGKKQSLDEALTLEGLLKKLGIEKQRVAIEKNLEIIPREEFATCRVENGDELEIVNFVGGGASPKKKSTASKSKGAGTLVIVESPAKCKTIGKYLGPGFDVAASMGHVIDLPKSKMGIDIDNDFTPRYIVSKDKKKVLTALKALAKGKENLVLACDPDREGEAISWHLKNVLGEGKKCTRVVFNEITKEAIQAAFKNPGEIDMNRVDAQQARRVLDRLVGYNLSPLLWQKVGRGLSAGRVQSVALRLIVDREREIRAFKAEEYWSIEAELEKEKGKRNVFKAKLDKIGPDKAEIKSKSQADQVLIATKSLPFIVSEIKHQKKKKNPYPPFTTSKLQQAAYNVLRFPAAKTMRTAQGLYEGVELGSEGSVGLITYMRTDSVRMADTAVSEIREFISKEFGKDYLPEKPNFYKSKKDAQGAHEAIRPSSILRRPKDIEQYLAPDQFKLYSLIWETALASQMTPAQIGQDSADITAGEYTFHAAGSRIEFPGYLAVRGQAEEEENPLPTLEPKEILKLLQLLPEQHFTKPPARFTDASLVKALEENGIGRPSTYAPTISTITGRDYVRREGGSLIPSDLGMLVTDLLVKHFSKLMDYEFTANMEEELDKVEEGQLKWITAVKDFYGVFGTQMDLAKTQMESVKREAEPTDEICEKCAKPMVIKWGRKGKFMACSGWPDCKNAKSISTNVPCPQCLQGKLVQRRSKMGKGRSFFGCTRYPDCNFIANRLPKPEGAAPADKEEKNDSIEDS